MELSVHILSLVNSSLESFDFLLLLLLAIVKFSLSTSGDPRYFDGERSRPSLNSLNF